MSYRRKTLQLIAEAEGGKQEVEGGEREVEGGEREADSASSPRSH